MNKAQANPVFTCLGKTRKDAVGFFVNMKIEKAVPHLKPSQRIRRLPFWGGGRTGCQTEKKREDKNFFHRVY